MAKNEKCLKLWSEKQNLMLFNYFHTASKNNSVCRYLFLSPLGFAFTLKAQKCGKTQENNPVFIYINLCF